MLCFRRAAQLALAYTAVAGPVLAQAAPDSTSKAPQGGAKIGYVNSQVLAAQTPGVKEATAQVQKEVASYRQVVQRMSDSLNTLVAEYDKQQGTLSPSARDARQKAIRAREAEYQARLQQLEDSVQARERQLMRPLMEKINATIEKVRDEEGYAMIFDAGSNAGVVVAADKSLDLTEKVLARLKASPPVSSKPAQKPVSAKPEEKKPSGAPVSRPAGVTRPKTPPDQP